MRTVLRQDLTSAIKARDRVAITALRSALAAIENAEAADNTAPSPSGNAHFAGSVAGGAEVPRRVLTEHDVRAIVEAEVQERSTSSAEYERLGREDAAERLHAEAAVLARYL
ncbi:GatB/YqeY domain-containing protein [Pseudonocardia spinosispora]|uniref:GatB/YqeY domain-containing protein n=1 Tax=Pseudonocardia spinosispora TaxID=103441 RepID=UPI00048CB945|nr:GatB/YqeY domain-containing protein [Pseudonocardia spinosispora]